MTRLLPVYRLDSPSVTLETKAMTRGDLMAGAAAGDSGRPSMPVSPGGGVGPDAASTSITSRPWLGDRVGDLP